MKDLNKLKHMCLLHGIYQKTVKYMMSIKNFNKYTQTAIYIYQNTWNIKIVILTLSWIGMLKAVISITFTLWQTVFWRLFIWLQ